MRMLQSTSESSRSCWFDETPGANGKDPDLTVANQVCAAIDAPITNIHENDTLANWLIDDTVRTVSSDDVNKSFYVQPPTLAEQSRAKIDALTELEVGWDGYQGIAVSQDAAEHALGLLETIGSYTHCAPDVAPLANGGLQLEWYVGNHEIEIEIAPNRLTLLYHGCVDDVREIVIDDLCSVAEFAPLFRELGP